MILSELLDMDGTGDTPYALDYSESMAFFNSAYNPTSAQSITATEFDSAQELLWAGSNEVGAFAQEKIAPSRIFRDAWLRSTVVNCENIPAFVFPRHRTFGVYYRSPKDP